MLITRERPLHLRLTVPARRLSYRTRRRAESADGATRVYREVYQEVSPNLRPAEA